MIIYKINEKTQSQEEMKTKRKKEKIYFFPIIRNIVVPHLGHLPFIARLSTPPLPFIATSLAAVISCFALHLTQYPSTIVNTSIF